MTRSQGRGPVFALDISEPSAMLVTLLGALEIEYDHREWQLDVLVFTLGRPCRGSINHQAGRSCCYLKNLCL